MKLICSIFLLLLISLFAISLFGQEQVKGGYKSCNIFCFDYKFGEIDSTSKHIWKENSFDANGRMIAENFYIRGEYDKTFYYDYNIAGNVVKKTICLDKYSIWRKFVYKYNEKNKLIEEVEYTSDGKVYGKDVYKYGIDGYALERQSLTEDGVLLVLSKFKFDGNGNMNEETQYSSEGELITKFEYKFDENGKNIEFVIYNKDGLISHKEKFIFNNSGKMIEQQIYSPKIDKVRTTTVYKYDSFGNIIESVNYDEINEPTTKSIYIYSK